jgi:hypothetical protein
MLIRLLFASFLLAHGAVHAGFVSPRPVPAPGTPPWPFELGRSWLLSPIVPDPGVVRVLGLALVAVTLAGFSLAAMASLGLLPPGLWAPSVAIGAAGSLALLVLFFHPWLLLGVAIDLGLLWAVLVRWAPEWLVA